MSVEQRPRGRPRGSGKNDTPYLAQVADLLVSDPSLKPTTAMKRVMRSGNNWGASDAALLRRWQVKWRAGKDSLLAAARDRALPIPPPLPRRLTPPVWMKPPADPMWRSTVAVKKMESNPFWRGVAEARKKMESDPLWRSIAEARKKMESDPFWRSVAEAKKKMEHDPFWKMVKDVRLQGRPGQTEARS